MLVINHPIIFLFMVYFISSIPFSLLTAKLLNGIDVREFGDKNPGASNAWNYGSKLAGLIGGLLDALKGGVPVLIVKRTWPQSANLLLLTAVTAVLGHAFSVYLQFQGGKSLAVSAGVFVFLFENLAPLIWIIIITVLPYLGIPFPEGVVITILIAIIQTFQNHSSWHTRLTVILISLIIIKKHQEALKEVRDNGQSFFTKLKHFSFNNS